MENDPYPGECGRYIDTNQDSICDLSKPIPNDSTGGNNQNAVELDHINEQTDDSDNVFTTLEEKDYNFELSIAIGLIGIFHVLWHTKYYLKIFTR